jgi:hypothetical protein
VDEQLESNTATHAAYKTVRMPDASPLPSITMSVRTIPSGATAPLQQMGVGMAVGTDRLGHWTVGLDEQVRRFYQVTRVIMPRQQR